MRLESVWIGMTATIYTLAIAMSSFRLIHRYRTKQYYWDDWGVAGCVICNVIIFVVLCIQREFPIEDVNEMNQVQCWLLWFCVSSSPWTSRLSIAFSVLRLIKFGIWRRRLTIAVIVVFTLGWMLSLVDHLIECNIKKPRQLDCSTRVANVVLFTVYVIGDACLLYIPLHLLRNLRLQRGTRFMIRVTFSVSGISTVATFVNAIAKFYEGPGSDIFVQSTSILKAPIALIACSLIVVIPCVYRLFKREEDWVRSFTMNMDVLDARSATASVVDLPERVVVRNRSFPEYLFGFHGEALHKEGSCIHGRAATV
ncbi:hypothetical protein M378DRAFT_368054 [Amanita muscaria Koide BX008]|uniref:Integral membrane protein n=1 Tax=Amanita muscaria (strain Koide BX008) TaxID=946122 RepID=A0A0C2THY0_AMAMK|nr:hypothetical protein M378DRAFT_368054 [Amanita muscaria Koide BX008]